MTEQHAKLSASNAHRWTTCPASVKEEAKYPNTTSKYAEEGNLAHEHAANILKYLYDPKEYEKIKNKPAPVDIKMQNYINDYIAVIDNILDDKINDFDVYIEHKVDYGNYLKDSWGTIDCAIYDKSKNVLNILDFKYGKGVKVDIVGNLQLILYSIGMQEYILKKYNIKNISAIKMYIVQPRIDNIVTSYLYTDEIDLKWIPFFKEKYKEVHLDNPKYKPTKEACRFCRAKKYCNALDNMKKEINKKILFDNNYKLTEEDEYYLNTWF